MSEEILVRLSDIEKRLAVLESHRMAKFRFSPEEKEMIKKNKKRNAVKKRELKILN